MDSLDQILQDVEEVLFVDSENDVCGKIPHDKNIKVNIDLVDQVCEKLIANNCMPTEVHEACRSVDRQELVSRMQFLERCFELPKTCLKNSSKEKVWTKFHMAMKDQDNLRSLDEMVTSAVSPWHCFEALNIMIRTVFDKFFEDRNQIHRKRKSIT
ncbi:uncharacterized protein LOC112554952 [Pomacea canaliculata]|uniref:uncharacterized protein LOC112554952 n=1 Tax=Pomacea canaliculata TaxID=400727 RepID=UPI000D72A4B3|nr:uncharacterized protein LOC112554952 [Pomacea canaliculata]